ncbi:hypothetical protein GCM10023147_51430 [Tsukamurella soli]|uniref:Uncharacterized protein n=1 Tax=Tsukamurella soli TaxID=644556 RepID=A0ABP8KIV9_9ACTN
MTVTQCAKEPHSREEDQSELRRCLSGSSDLHRRIRGATAPPGMPGARAGAPLGESGALPIDRAIAHLLHIDVLQRKTVAR